MKRLFVAATRQNDGKTMTSLGLFHAFQKRFPEICYMKPVGQQFIEIDGEKIDKDAVLFHQIYNLTDPLPHMSPVAVPKGFTESYIQNPDRDILERRITQSFDILSKNKEFALIEGTGHAGVGSVFDMANADVANILGAGVILVSMGGIGRAIDELMLNKAAFEIKGINILGVIINKVRQEKYDKVSEISKAGLERQGIDVFGMIPFVNQLTYPTIAEIYETLNARVLAGEELLSSQVERYLIGDMQPHEAMNFFQKGTLLIVPANREGLYLTAICRSILEPQLGQELSGIIFSGGSKPHPRMLDMIKKTNIPLLSVEEDSFTIASKINKMLVKLRSEEKDKIKKIQGLVEEYVDIDRICESLDG